MLIYEKERSNKEFYLYHQNDENLSFPLHIHDSYEIFCVIDGEIILTIEDKEYVMHKDDCAIILSNEAHSYETKEYSKSYLCIISKDYIPFFSNKMANLRATNPVFKLHDTEDFINKFKNPKNLFYLKGHIYKTLGMFVENTDFVESVSNKNFLHIILDFINEHYAEDITLKDISKQMGYTYNYSSMLFNQIFKTSFSEFLNECRISFACNLLRESDSSISEIASLCGYNSLRMFNRNFFKFKNMTPTQFRKNI